MQRLFKQFSFPGGIPSHVAPETPGSIHEGGELGYSLLHAYGAVFDNPDLLACCVVGDGEAETGPLATSWHSNKFLNPARDGAVLPDSASERLQDRRIRRCWRACRNEELTDLFNGYGYKPYFVEGDDPEHDASADGRRPWTRSLREIRAIQQRRAHAMASADAPAWPMIVLRTPKGWTGPKVVDGKQVEGTFRAHQVPLDDLPRKPGTSEDARRLDEELPARGTVRRERQADSGTRGAGAQGRRGAWAPTRTPTAACCCATCSCPISATTRWTCRSPARSMRKPRA